MANLKGTLSGLLKQLTIYGLLDKALKLRLKVPLNSLHKDEDTRSSSTAKESSVISLFHVSVLSRALCPRGRSLRRLTRVNEEALLERPREIKTRHYSSTHSKENLLAELAASWVELNTLFG